MNNTLHDRLFESAETNRIKEVIIKQSPATISDAIRIHDRTLGSLGVWLCVMVWAEDQFDQALEQAQPHQRVQFYRGINPQKESSNL